MNHYANDLDDEVILLSLPIKPEHVNEFYWMIESNKEKIGPVNIYETHKWLLKNDYLDFEKLEEITLVSKGHALDTTKTFSPVIRFMAKDKEEEHGAA